MCVCCRLAVRRTGPAAETERPLAGSRVDSSASRRPAEAAVAVRTHPVLERLPGNLTETTRRAAAPYRRCRRRACMRACRLGAGPHAMGLTASGRHDLNQLTR